eukprot:931627-Pyramimonas_sp.AAC.1
MRGLQVKTQEAAASSSTNSLLPALSCGGILLRGYTLTSFYGSSCANNGKGALNTPAAAVYSSAKLRVAINSTRVEIVAVGEYFLRRVDSQNISKQVEVAYDSRSRLKRLRRPRGPRK